MLKSLFGANSSKEGIRFDPREAVKAFIDSPSSGTAQWGISSGQELSHWQRVPLEDEERTFAIAYFPHLGESMWESWRTETAEETLRYLEQVEAMKLPRKVDEYKPFGVVDYRYFDVAETERAAAVTASPTIVLELGKIGVTDVINLYYGHGYNNPGIAFMKLHEFAGLEVSRIYRNLHDAP